MPWDFWLIFAVLALLLPWRGRERMSQLRALRQVTGRDRIKLYLSTILFQWLVTAVIAWRAFARGLVRLDLGISKGEGTAVIVVTVLGAILIAAGHWMNLRRMASSNHPSVESLRALGARLFPGSPVELAVYLLLALTAGVCEEFMFRGFVIAALLRFGLATWIVIVLSSVLFGLAHLYQGKGGSIATGLLGALFAMARISYHSLLPVTVWHAVLDLVAGIAGPKYLRNKAEEPEKLSPVQA